MTMWNRRQRDQRRWGRWAFELRDDEIADLRYDDRQVLRSVRAVIRDADWQTVPLIVDTVTELEHGLELSVHSSAALAFRGVVRIEADAAELTVSTDLRAGEDLWTNRTGLVVLHPPQLAGRDLILGRADGTTERTRFPERISAHQPVFDISSLEWEDGGSRTHVHFHGDVFEMEDQRNWTDASFKTYSRPLALPFPYRVAADEQIHQSVRITVAELDDAAASAPAVEQAVLRLAPGGSFPGIGVSASSAPDPVPDVEPVGGELLVELDLSSTNWTAALARAVSTGQRLDVRLILDPAAPGTVASAVRALDGIDVCRISAFHRVGDARHVSDAEAIGLVRDALAGRRVPIIGGSRSHFTELNREFHRLPDELDGLAVTVTPLFHSTDTEQLVESVAIQRIVAEETVQRAAGIPVHIGPVSLRPRFNDVATGPQPASTLPDLAAGYGAQFTGIDDPRQGAAELAAWTVASAAALAVPGVATLVWYEEWGPRGIRDTAGTPVPAGEALRQLAELAAVDDAVLLSGPSPDGRVWALGARTADGDDILAANIADEERVVTVQTSAGTAQVALAAASFTRIRLRPEAVSMGEPTRCAPRVTIA